MRRSCRGVVAAEFIVLVALWAVFASIFVAIERRLITRAALMGFSRWGAAAVSAGVAPAVVARSAGHDATGLTSRFGGAVEWRSARYLAHPSARFYDLVYFETLWRSGEESVMERVVMEKAP